MQSRACEWWANEWRVTSWDLSTVAFCASKLRFNIWFQVTYPLKTTSSFGRLVWGSEQLRKETKSQSWEAWRGSEEKGRLEKEQGKTWRMNGNERIPTLGSSKASGELGGGIGLAEDEAQVYALGWDRQPDRHDTRSTCWTGVRSHNVIVLV